MEKTFTNKQGDNKAGVTIPVNTHLALMVCQALSQVFLFFLKQPNEVDIVLSPFYK